MSFQVNNNRFLNPSKEGFFSTATSYELRRTESFQGTTAGFTSSGYQSNTIDKFPFATEANATDHGDLSVARSSVAGHSSTTHGYSSGGENILPSPAAQTSAIDRFSFSSNVTATSVGDLTMNRSGASGHSSALTQVGFASGGWQDPFPQYRDRIDRFPFASSVTATTVGNLTVARNDSAANSSDTHGYNTGANVPPNNRIDKFSFVNDGSATTVGNLSNSAAFSIGQSSVTNGYSSGGNSGGNPVSAVHKFPFATDTNSSAVANLLSNRSSGAGQSSTSYGYASGGRGPTGSAINSINRFSFSVDSNSFDVGDLTSSRNSVAGHQD